MKNRRYRDDAVVNAINTQVAYKGSRPGRAAELAVGQLVEWYEDEILFRGIISEVVPARGRPATPGFEVTRFTNEATYVIQGGRVLSSGTVKTVKLLWPRCVKFNLVTEEQMSCT